MSQDRTEKPSAKKLKDARKRGQIPRSKDLAVAAATIAGTLALAQFGGVLVGRLSDRLASDLSHFGDAPQRTVAAGDVTSLVIQGVALMTMLVGPIALATMIAGVGVYGMQGGWNFAPEALQVDFTRLSPVKGFKRFGLTQAGVDTLKTMVAVAIIAFLSWKVVDAVIADSLRLPWLSPTAAALAAWGHVEALLWKVAWGLAVIALADYGLQWYRVMSQLKMTKQEVRDEARQSEGNAEVKGRVRRIQRDMARRRMLDDVSRATVVVTNPTHFAVALEYRRETMAAPVVLAKGQDHLALRIRERAREHGVPIVENKPLAQALYKTAEVGETIPGPLFAAVAEVLAQLIRLKRLML